jgi:hypothetical protein
MHTPCTIRRDPKIFHHNEPNAMNLDKLVLAISVVLINLVRACTNIKEWLAYCVPVSWTDAQSCSHRSLQHLMRPRWKNLKHNMGNPEAAAPHAAIPYSVGCQPLHDI